MFVRDCTFLTAWLPFACNGMCSYFFHIFILWSWWQPCYSSTYSSLHDVLRDSLVTPYRSRSDGVLTGEGLATPPLSMVSLLKQFCRDLTQPVFLQPQRTHKNTLVKSETTLQHAHKYECVCVCVAWGYKPPLHTWEILDSTWLCCGYAWTHNAHTYPYNCAHVRIPSKNCNT